MSELRILREYEIAGERYAIAIPRKRRAMPKGWTDASLGPGSVNIRRRHESGWEIRHCGHPTANWPYTAHHVDGRMLTAPNGRGFQTLALAMAAVEMEVAHGRGA